MSTETDPRTNECGTEIVERGREIVRLLDLQAQAKKRAGKAYQWAVGAERDDDLPSQLRSIKIRDAANADGSVSDVVTLALRSDEGLEHLRAMVTDYVDGVDRVLKATGTP